MEIDGLKQGEIYVAIGLFVVVVMALVMLGSLKAKSGPSLARLRTNPSALLGAG